MLLTTTIFFSILGSSTLSAAKPIHSRQEPPVSGEICPENWQFDLQSFSGPGCPDSSPSFNRSGHSLTTPDWGSHYVPGCQLQWAWFSFPWLQGYISQPSGDVYLSDQKRNATWCEMKIKYREMRGTFAPYDVPKGKEEYRLVMHGNGTTVEAKYGLDEGVRAVWRFTYSPVRAGTRPKIVDEIVVKGPVWNQTKPATRLDWSTVDQATPKWTEDNCGPAVFTMRIDLALESENPNATGAIESKQSIFSGNWFGPTVGISHSWVRCVR